MRKIRRSDIQLVVYIAALMPLILLLFDWYQNNLTINPIQAATLRTGKTALVLLTLSLAITPLNTLFNLKQLIPLRKWLGLFAALYVAVHFYIFIGLDYGFDFGFIKQALFERRFTLVGLVSGLLLLLLAITSTQGWQRRLGKNWKRLHRLVYPAAILATVHYLWLVKSDIRLPLIYMAIVLLLLILRLPRVRKVASRFRRIAPKRYS